MKKKPTISKLKKELDAIFSRYIRLRDSKDGIAKCISCKYVGEWKKMTCGHYVSRQHNITRYDEQNCSIQCWMCNTRRYGNMAEYTIALQERYGEGIIKKLRDLSRETKQFTVPELEALIKTYEKKLEKLLTV